jgi:hypothetical protein
MRVTYVYTILGKVDYNNRATCNVFLNTTAQVLMPLIYIDLQVYFASTVVFSVNLVPAEYKTCQIKQNIFLKITLRYISEDSNLSGIRVSEEPAAFIFKAENLLA